MNFWMYCSGSVAGLYIPRPLDFVSRNVDKHLAVNAKNISEDLNVLLNIRLFKFG